MSVCPWFRTQLIAYFQPRGLAALRWAELPGLCRQGFCFAYQFTCISKTCLHYSVSVFSIWVWEPSTMSCPPPALPHPPPPPHPPLPLHLQASLTETCSQHMSQMCKSVCCASCTQEGLLCIACTVHQAPKQTFIRPSCSRA